MVSIGALLSGGSRPLPRGHVVAFSDLWRFWVGDDLGWFRMLMLPMVLVTMTMMTDTIEFPVIFII